MRIVLSLFILLLSQCLYANDGAFYASGNQLIPISETEISVQKEVLKIKKLDNKYIQVSVYYEFFNPGNAKEIIVGFEAMSPNGDVDGAPKNGKHPYMRDFTVQMNNKALTYQVAYVEDSLYNQAGKIKAIDLKTFKGNKEGNEVDFFYVYHFKANFKKGKNIIKHTYTFDVSGGVAYNYYFEYVLTAANRWANKQIDDFTLEIDMGEFEDFYLSKSFYKHSKDWKIKGQGKVQDVAGSANSIINVDASRFYIRKGSIVFQKKNFRPKGELYIQSFSPNIGVSETKGVAQYLPYSIYAQDRAFFGDNKTAKEKKILRNLPYARRGYIFKDKELQSVYTGLAWYMPNANYSPADDGLWQAERDWMKQWK